MHSISGVDLAGKYGHCSTCGPVRVYGSDSNKNGNLVYKCAEYCKTRDRHRKQNEHTRKTSVPGLNRGTRNALITRAGQCAICTTTVDLIVDHDHETNAIRGVLCKSCNTALGFFYDSPMRLRNAIKYLGQY